MAKNFRLFEHEPFNPDSLRHNLIQTMYYDRDEDLLWLGTYRGVSVLDPVTEKIRQSVVTGGFDARKELDFGVVTAIEKDREGNFWVGTLDGLVRINQKTGGSFVYNHEEGNPRSLPDKTVRDVLCDSGGNVWIATINGLSLFKEEYFINYFQKDPPGLSGLNINAAMTLEEYSPGILLVGSWGGGVTCFNSADGSYFSRSLDDNRLYILKRDREGHIWAGTWGGGLYYYKNLEALRENDFLNTVYNHENSYSLSNDIVYSIFEDKSGLLWIGTNGGGVNKLNQLQKDYRFLYSTGKPGSIGNDRFRSLMLDEKERLWIGSYNSGLYVYDPENGRTRNYVNNPDDYNSISNETVNSVFRDSENNIWVLTNSGLDRFDQRKEHFEHYRFNGQTISLAGKPEGSGRKTSGNGVFYAVMEDSSGQLWLGTYNDGIYRWNRRTGAASHFSVQSLPGKRLSDNMVYSIVEDKKGVVWIATNNGLNSYDPASGIMLNYYNNPADPYSLCHDNVRVLYCDSTGNLWVGTTGGGLSRFDSEQKIFYNFSKKDGLDHNTVIGLTEDQKGNIIAVTLKGISLVERKPENKFTTITSLTYQFGLSGIDFKGGIAWDRKGNIYVAATGEIYRLDTAFYYLNRFNPGIIITDLRIFDKSYIDIFKKNIFAEEEINLKWNENYISFDFTSIDYTFPSGRKYKYMLEGFDKGWVYSGERNFTSYISIPPGVYRFRVTGTNSSGFWSTNEASLKIRIIPPFYNTGFAYFIYILFAAAIFYGILMIIRGKEVKKRLEEVSRLKDELLTVNLKLDIQTRMDILTEVHNRKHFNEVFENLWDLYTRTGINFTILMLDIDYFKNYNDTYGHIAGDKCLKEVAGVILEAVSRKTDSVFRYGGEEFAVFLVDTDTAGARIVAERIRTKVMEKCIPNRSALNKTGILTVSIGIAGTKGFMPENPNQLLIEADKNLYRAKENGRNTVV